MPAGNRTLAEVPGLGYGRPLGLHGRAIVAGLAVTAVLALAPATASAAGLIAAYDRYVTGKGFEIGLVNALTGATLALPAGVNTNDDELHPTLTPDGRYLVFMRTKLLPKLNGDIVPPEARTLFVADRETGTVTSLNRTGAGPCSRDAGTPRLGGAPVHEPAVRRAAVRVSISSPRSPAAPSPEARRNCGIPPPAGSSRPCTPTTGRSPSSTTSSSRTSDFSARYLSYAVLNSTTGALQSQTVQFTTMRDATPAASARTASTTNHGSASALRRPPGRAQRRLRRVPHGRRHPDPELARQRPRARAGADHARRRPERDPAWSPDGLNLGFIRTVDGQRRLGVFNATPGIQTILNPLASLGPEAPTPQTRAYQEVWGGLSIAEGAPSSAPVIDLRRALPRAAAARRLDDDPLAHAVDRQPDRDLRRARGRQAQAARPHRAAAARGRQGAARRRQARAHPQALERQGEREAPASRHVPADLPLAARASRSRTRRTRSA